MTVESVIKISDRIRAGLNVRTVFGLNIFAENEVEVPPADDPRIIFLRTLGRQADCSAHTGNLFDFADGPVELFGPPVPDRDYMTARTGIYGGQFYDADRWSNFPPCLFLTLTENFWDLRTGDDVTIRDILERDALALYVAPTGGAREHLRSLAQAPFPGHEDWLQEVVKSDRVGVLPQSDGGYFEVYSRDRSNFEMLTLAISRAARSIEGFSWYQQNASSLVWDDELHLSPMLPEDLRK